MAIISKIQFTDFELDLNLMELKHNGALVDVEPQVFDLIKFFSENAGQLVTRDDIIDGVWGGRIVSDAAISTRINMARKAVGDDGKAQKIIKTIPRRGFRFLPEAQIIEADASTASDANPNSVTDHLSVLDKPSIVVLPITCLCDDIETQNLSFGLRVDLQNALIKVSGLVVLAWGSANAVVDLPQKEAAEKLGVRYIIKAQVRRAEEYVRLSVQLVDMQTGQIKWSEQYDRKLEETFKLIDELILKILTAVSVKLVAGETARVWHKMLSDVKSLEVHYRGINNFFKMNRASMKVAQRDFENIARYHPDLPLGPTWISLTHWFMLQRGWADSAEESRQLARKWAEKAITFKDIDGQAYTVLSHICLLDRDFDAALKGGAAAIDIRPSCAPANGFYANVLHYCGKQNEALHHIRLAIRHSPIHPPLFKLILAATLRAKGELEEATAVANQVLVSNPEDMIALTLLAALMAEKGQMEKAAEYGDAIRHVEPGFSIGDFLQRHPYRDQAMSAGISKFLLLERIRFSLNRIWIPKSVKL